MNMRNSWEVGSFAACIWLAAACGSSANSGTVDNGATTTESGGTPATSTPTTGGSAGSTTTSTTATTATTTGGSAGATSSSTSTTPTSTTSGSAGMAAMPSATVKAIAKLKPFMAGGMTMATGTAGAGGGSGTAGAGAASSGGISGNATFTKARAGVDVAINIMGCENGKVYAVHIHQGTSCDSVMTQMGHWGAAAATAGTGSAGASGSGVVAGASASAAGAAAGAGASAAGAGGSGGAMMTKAQLRGEGIPDIKCVYGTGVSSTTRSTPDRRLNWTIGTMDEADVVGHVVVVHDPSGARVACGKIMLQ